jgi:glycosyltransferase involved in cell wall biosynthesis
MDSGSLDKVMPEATVIIPTRNRANELRACLAALSRQEARGRFDILVVDNGSQDETSNIIAASARDDVHGLYVEQPNRAKARNAGIAVASGSLIIFCDDDTFAPEGFVAAHLAVHAATQNAVVTGPIINVPDASQLSAPGRRHWSRAFFCTCNVSVAKSALEAVGGFDEDYNLYGWEDTDLGVRLRAEGLRRVFSWDAYIYHIKPPETLALERRRALAQEKGAMAAHFVRKSPTWPVKLATGAYALNFARAALLSITPLHRLAEHLAKNGRGSVVSALASDVLIDATYIHALRRGLR